MPGCGCRRSFTWSSSFISSESNPLPTLTTHVWDKLLHATEYAGLAVLLCRALLGEGSSWTAAIVVAAAVASIYGATDEIHQLFTPGRDSSVFDWLADTIGSSLGAIAYAMLIAPAARVRDRRH